MAKPLSEAQKTDDEMYAKAVDLVVRTQNASVSMIQRRLRIGFSQAAGYLDEMEATGIVSHYVLLRGRRVLIQDAVPQRLVKR